VTSSSTPVSFDTSSGLLTVYSSDDTEAGTTNYVITVGVYDDADSSLIGSEAVYNYQVVVSYNPEDIYVGTS
jgi:hypothetical protein